MAKLLPLNFPLLPEPSIASYPYDDVADATGFILFYPYAATDTDSEDHLLATTALYSRPREVRIDATGGGGPWTETATFTSTTFNAPRILRGRMLFDFFREFSASGAGTIYTEYIEVKLYHYDGSSETQLGSTWVSESIAIDGDVAVDKDAMETGYIDVATSQKFKVGDSVRIKVILHLSEVGGAGISTFIVHHDPVNREAPANASHTFRTFVPFKIEV